MSATNRNPSGSTPATLGKIVVQMRSVIRYFGNPGLSQALTDVTFDVRRGEVFGLLGPSGSGKSTVIRILAGRLSPSQGKARVLGHSPRWPPTRTRVGYLPQHSIHTRSQFLVEAFGFLGDLFEKQESDSRRPRVSAEPAGRERRGLLKQVLVKNPDLLLLDEPFAGLDMSGCREMVDFIRALAQQGRTVILSSNSLTFARDICDRLAVLSRGRIEATGTLRELLATRDSLRYIGQLLPQPTAERLLQMIRQELGMSDLPVNTPRGAPKGIMPGANTEAAGDAALARLAKVAALDSGPANHLIEPGSTVNQELLAALTRRRADDSPPASPRT